MMTLAVLFTCTYTETFFQMAIYGTLHSLMFPLRDVDILSVQIFRHELVFVVVFNYNGVTKKSIFVTFILRKPALVLYNE